MGPKSLSCYELPWSLACLPSLYTRGKLKSESPETDPRSRTGGVLSPWVSCPAPGLLSTYGHHKVVGIGDPHTDPQGGPDLRTRFLLWGSLGGHMELGDGKGS